MRTRRLRHPRATNVRADENTEAIKPLFTPGTELGAGELTRFLAQQDNQIANAFRLSPQMLRDRGGARTGRFSQVTPIMIEGRRIDSIANREFVIHIQQGPDYIEECRGYGVAIDQGLTAMAHIRHRIMPEISLSVHRFDTLCRLLYPVVYEVLSSDEIRAAIREVATRLNMTFAPAVLDIRDPLNVTAFEQQETNRYCDEIVHHYIERVIAGHWGHVIT